MEFKEFEVGQRLIAKAGRGMSTIHEKISVASDGGEHVRYGVGIITVGTWYSYDEIVEKFEIVLD